ncbi:MAG: hypothetical protein GTO60_03360, partial [Gammaproteobacteria bacterium]|nr:hypothetical protein [Gammaproteobacteria bacterium]
MTTSEGKYVLVLPIGSCVLEISKENYTRSHRWVLSAPGFSSPVFDTRLTPLFPEAQSLVPGGGTLSNGSGVLVYPDGAVDMERTARLTKVGPQGLAGRLPSGWSPLQVFDLHFQDDTTGDLLKPCQLRCINHWPDASSSSFILALWDETGYKWKAVSTVSVSPEDISGTIEKKGQYAFLIKDTAPAAPPQPVLGEPLPAVAQGSVPNTITTNLNFNPEVIYPGDRSQAVLTITSAEAIASGTPVQAKISENYELLSGSTAAFIPYTADLTAYNYGTAFSKVEFHVSPNSKITLSELKIGTIQSDMVRYSAGALGMVVGPDGATVAGDGGSEIVIEPGSVNAPIAVTLKKLDPVQITTPLPSGFEVIGAIDLSLGGAKLLKPGIISLSLSQEQLSNIPQDAQLLTVKLEKLTHELVWVLTSQGIVENSRIKSFMNTGTGLTFPGVREGGTYVFLRALSPLGFISGTVTQNAQPFSGALVSLPTHEIRAISRAAGNYVQVGFTGDVELTAKDLVTGNQGTGSGNIQDPGDILPLSIAIMATGPEIVSITPENNAEEVPLNSKITFIFSKPVKAAAFTDQTVYINKGTDKIGGVFQLSSNGKQGEFIPHQDFASDSTISITVTTGLQDLNGTPMAQVFNSAFKTVDVAAPEADFAKITIHMPVNGKSTVVGEVGAVEPGAAVIVFNERTGKAVTVTGLSDGSFSAEIEAIDTDRITIKVRDTAGNETVLAAKLYVSADGKQVIMDSRGGEFISREGLGIRVEAGTFTGSTRVGLSDVSTDSTLAPPPQDFNIIKAVRVDFSGNNPMRPFTLSIPSPAGIPEDAQLMVVQQVEVFGKKQWMYVGMASLVKPDQQVQPGGTIPEDQSQPSGGGGLPLMMAGPAGTGTTFWRWEGEAKDQPYELYERIWAFMWNWNARFAFAVMTFMNPHAMVSAMDLVLFTHPQELIMPFPINRSVEIEVRDLDTGEMLFRKDLPALTSPGQLYDFGNLAAGEYDKDPPAITGSTGMLILSYDVSPNTVVSRGITITPQVSEEQVTGIQIQGKPGTAVVVEPGDTPGKVRIYRLEEDTSDPTSEGQKRYTQLSDSFNVKEDGSFSGSVSVKKGDRLIITVETGDVDLGQEFLLSFSEPLDMSYQDTDVPIEFYEVTEETGEEKIKVYTDLLDTGTDVLVKPENQLKENVKYVVKFMEVLDRAGNPLELTCEFHTKRSRTLLSQGNMQNAYDTLVIGDKLFVAAGQDGIKVFDVSDPSKLGYVTTHSVLGSVFALDLHIGADGKKNLVAVGGGSADGFIKLFEIDDLYDPNKPDLIYQTHSQVISEWLGMEGAMGGYVDGVPRDVYVLDNYAFVAVMGGGLVIVDLELMKDMTTQSALIGYWPYDELVSKVHAFKKEIKDPDNPDAPAQTRYYAVLLVEYFGIRILDVTDADHPKEWAFLNLGKNENLAGLDVALDYWVDVDLDGRKGDEEDLDTEKDINDTPEMREVNAREELKDLLFFTVPSEGKVYVVDFTNHPGAGAELNIKKTIPIADARLIGDIRLSEKDQLLYAADNILGLVLLDVSFNGHTLDRAEEEEDRVLGTIDTSGKSQFGITIDEDLNVAYVGQLEKGVDMVKLANPEVKFVYLDSDTGIYHEVEKAAAMELRERDNPADPVTGKKLPGEIYVMAVLPGDIGLKSDMEDGKFFVEAVLWSLNKYHHPIISWDDGSGVKSYFKKLKLYRQSDNPYEEKFKMFLSKPLQVTIDPVKPESGTPGGNDPIKVLSGDFLWVHLSEKVHENLANSGESNVYLTRNDCRLSGDKKPSVRVDLVDRYKNLDKNEEEKPNSPVNNPAMYNSVYLHSGEFVHSDADMIIPGRGFDFAFIRTYRSQGIYSGVLGWGWDHNYNKRLLEMPGGDILYFDGTGRRERYKAQKAGSRITGYIVPDGWFTQLKKKEDGTFRLIYPDLTVEYYDEKGMLIKIKDRNDNRMEFYYDIAGQMTAVMDTMGRMIDFEYYPLEFEAADSDPEGRIKITSGRLKQITDFSGRVITYEYSQQTGDLEKVTFAGRGTRYTYTANADLKLAHNLTTSKDPEDRTVFTVTYEDVVDKAKEQQQGDSVVAYSTGESGASVTDGRGNIKVFNIQNGHPEQISEGGYQTIFDYNYDGLVRSVTYPELNSITYEYPTVTDKTNKRKAANLDFIRENPGPRGDGGSPIPPATTTFSYESMYNQVRFIEYPNGLSVTNSNEDDNGNFRRVETNVEGLSYDLGYNDYGQVTWEKNLFGMTTSYKYYSEASPGGNESSEMGRIPDSDTGGYLETMTSDLVTRNFQEYDKRGNLLNYNDSHGTTANYSFTDHDELQTENVVSASSMSPLFYSGQYGYYQNGLLQSQQTTFGSDESAVSNSYTYKYTLRNMLETETESDRGIVTTYTYDQNDNLTGISNTLDSISFTYNDRDLVETVKLGSDVGGSTFIYDGNGNVTTATDKYGNTTTYQYDGYDRLKTIIDPLNNQTLISRLDNGNTLNIKQYDAAENMLRETVRVNDPIGRVKQYTVKMPTGNDETYSYTYAYTGSGQVITISDSLSRTWTISKNEKGQVYYQEDPAGNTIEYFYEDGRGNMTRMIETEVQADGTKKTYTTHYTYNAFNKIEEIKETVGDGETIYTTFTYDERGNLTGSKDAEGNTISHKYDNFGRRIWSKRHFKSTGATITTRFEYYANDMLWKIIDDKENVTEYKYDDQKRLTRVIYPDNSEINFTYTEEIVDNKKYRVVIETQRNGTTVTSSYDGLNRLVSRISIPAGGVGGISESYEYDGLNRLTKASDNDTTVEFAYDPLNRLTEEKQQGKVIGYTYSVVNNLRKMT